HTACSVFGNTPDGGRSAQPRPRGRRRDQSRSGEAFLPVFSEVAVVSGAAEPGRPARVRSIAAGGVAGEGALVVVVVAFFSSPGAVPSPLLSGVAAGAAVCWPASAPPGSMLGPVGESDFSASLSFVSVVTFFAGDGADFAVAGFSGEFF